MILPFRRPLLRMKRARNRQLLLLLVAALLTLLPVRVCAELSITPSFTLGQEYNDNFNLTADPVPVWRSFANAGIDTHYLEDEWEMSLNGQYRGSRYLNEPDLDADDGYLTYLGRFSTEYTQWTVSAGATLDHPSSSQLQAGAQVFDRIERLIWNVNPSFVWNIDEVSRLTSGYGYNNTSYADNPNRRSTQSDFFTHSGFVQYSRSLSERLQIYMQGQYIRTVNDELRFSTDQYILRAGFDYAFSETLNISAGGGGLKLYSTAQVQRLVPNFTTFQFDRVEETRTSDQVGYILNFSIDKRLETGRLQASFNRNLAPTAGGGQLELNALQFNGRKNLTDTLDLLATIDLSNTRQIAGTVSQLGRNRVNASLRMDWEFAENWFLEGGYTHNLQKIETRSAITHRNRVFISVSYTSPNLYPFD